MYSYMPQSSFGRHMIVFYHTIALWLNFPFSFKRKVENCLFEFAVMMSCAFCFAFTRLPLQNKSFKLWHSATQKIVVIFNINFELCASVKNLKKFTCFRCCCSIASFSSVLDNLWMYWVMELFNCEKKETLSEVFPVDVNSFGLDLFFLKIISTLIMFLLLKNGYLLRCIRMKNRE